MEKNTICSACGVTLTDEATIEFDGKIFCDECLRKKTIICDCCGKRIYRDEAQGDEIVGALEIYYKDELLDTINLIAATDINYKEPEPHKEFFEIFKKLLVSGCQ